MAKEKTRSLRQAKSIDDLCEVKRDHFAHNNWTIMTDGYRVWISQQKMGEKRTAHIEVPKAIFDKLYDAYGKPQPLGEWRNEKFCVAR